MPRKLVVQHAKEYTPIRQLYAWVGFFAVWGGLTFALYAGYIPMLYTHSNHIETAKKTGMYNCLIGYARKTGNPKYAVEYCNSLDAAELQRVSRQVWDDYINRQPLHLEMHEVSEPYQITEFEIRNGNYYLTSNKIIEENL